MSQILVEATKRAGSLDGANVDARIEPVPVGQQQFLEDQTSPIVEMARREGIAIDGDDL